MLLSSRAPATVSSLPLAVHSDAGWTSLAPVSARVPAAPDTVQVAQTDVPSGRYDAVRLGSSEAEADFEVSAGKVEPVLLAVVGRSVEAGGVYAGNEAVNLGLGEIAGRYTSLPDFTLVDQNGVKVTNADLRGEPTVIAAFHTTCRATCPLYTGLMLQLQKQAHGVHLVEVTTDPGDSPRMLAAYARRVGISYELLTGSAAELSAFWAPLQVQLSNVDAHVSTLAVADAHGFLRLVYRGVPDLAALPPVLSAQLDPAGLAELGHGDGWGTGDVASSLRTLDSLFQGRRPATGPAPGFSAGLLSGGSVSLARLAGQPVVINFWASYCPICTSEVPGLVAAARSHPGLVLLLIDERDDPSAARSFLASLRLHPLVAVDPNGVVGEQYGVQGLPATFFIRPDGTLAGSYLGQIDPATATAEMAEVAGQ